MDSVKLDGVINENRIVKDAWKLTPLNWLKCTDKDGEQKLQLAFELNLFDWELD